MLAAVTMVKDEADIIGYTLRHMLQQGVDLLIVADNMSEDRTPEILESIRVTWPERVRVVPDLEVGYYQSEKMTSLALMALDHGAEWVIPFDADEWWYSPTERRLSDLIRGVPPTVGSLGCVGWDHLVQRGEPAGGNPFADHPWRRRAPQKLPKIAFRPNPDAKLHMGNHDVNNVPGERLLALQLRHIQYRSLEQMTRKLRQGRVAYEASTVPALHGQHWREGGLWTDEEMAARWESLLDEDGLIHDPVPGARGPAREPAAQR